MNDNGLVPYEGKKGKRSGRGVKQCLPLETNDMTAILNMTIEVSTKRAGRPAEYPNTKQGLDEFIQCTIDYFEYVNTVNANPDLERKLIADIESWSVFLGITRQTLWIYEQRGGEWADCIQYYKNAIGAVKKQLALNYKIPPMIYVFDATNNHNYVNSTEFKLDNNGGQLITATADETARVSDLIWSDITKRYEPMEG